MARGTTLGELVTMVREEANRNTNAAYGQATLDITKNLIRRTYRRLHADWTWPHLRIFRNEQMQAGERYYTLDPDLDTDRIEAVVTRENVGDVWRPVDYGIDPLIHYNSFDPDQDDRSDPVRAWQVYEGGQFEVWPIPASDTPILRFTGISKPVNLVNDSDRCDLDDNLITLYAAAQILAREKSADAEMKLEEAAAHYRRLKANSQHNPIFRTNLPRSQGWPGIKVRAPGT